jgi:hypothetical protein
VGAAAHWLKIYSKHLSMVMRLSRFFIFLCASAVLLLGAHPSSVAAQKPCVFTASQLSKLTGDPLLEPEVRKPTARYSVNCAFESENNRGKKVFVTVRTQESRAEFDALQRLAYLTNKDSFIELKDVGRAAFLTPYAMRAWDGTSSVSIKGMKDLLSREISANDAATMLQLGLKQLPGKS